MPIAIARRATKFSQQTDEHDDASPPFGRFPSPAAPPERGSKRTVTAVAGAAIVLLCTALGAVVASRANERQDYLAVARYVPSGAVITAAELASVSVTPASGLAAIPVADSASVLGRHADVALEPGSLLVTSDLGQGATLPSSDALVGTSLSPDQVPLDLEAGDSVLVLVGGPSAGLSGTPPAGGVSTPGSTSQASGSGVLAHGIVASIAAPSSGLGASSSDIVTIEVPSDSAPAVAAASAAGDVSLAQVPARATR